MALAASAALLVCLLAASPAAVMAQSGSTFTLPLYFGVFTPTQWYVPAVVGKANVNLTFDTGSTPVYTAPKAQYNPASSGGLCGPNTTSFCYHSGCISGYVCTDTVTVGSNALPNYSFINLFNNASESKEALSKQGNMGWATPSNASSNTVLRTLASSGRIPRAVFSTWTTMDVSTPGELLVGGVNQSRYTGSLAYAPIVPNRCTNASNTSCYRTDVANNTFLFWQFTAQVTALYGNNPNFNNVLCRNCTIIADSGTGDIVTPTRSVGIIQKGYGAGRGSRCMTALLFTFSNGQNVTWPLNQAKGCSPIVPPCAFKNNTPAVVNDPSTWWTLGAPFTSSFYMVWDEGNRQLGMATPKQPTWPNSYSATACGGKGGRRMLGLAQ